MITIAITVEDIEAANKVLAGIPENVAIDIDIRMKEGEPT